ncbi:MAG: alpha-L-fucosidase [Niabella sp.]
MKYIFITLLVAYLFTNNIYAQSGAIPFANTIKINSGDSKERILEKAVHVIPTTNQYAALKDEFIAFIHFGPNTFTRMEWGNGMEDPKIFDLKNLDTDQWCKAMKDAGMTKVIITAKHHDGFVLWQSRYTKHGIMSTNFKSGKGDIVKELATSCKKYKLKLGIYLSPADLFQIESPKGLYGNLSEYTTRTIPRTISGRPFKNKTTFKFKVDDYNEYFLNQLFELLTEYGPVDEIWFDGAHPKRKGGQTYNYAAWKKLIRTLAPKAVVFGKEDIRWCGNEAGATRNTEWNIIPYAQDPDTASFFTDLMKNDIGSREKLYEANYLHYQPAETNTSIREGWFYRDDTYQKVRNADDVFDMYERSVGGNSVFLLNIPPNRDGRFSDEDVRVLQESGKRIRQTYGNNLFQNAKGAAQVLDNKATTYWLLNNKDSQIIITTPKPVTINRIMIQEAIVTHSERVEQHAVDAWMDNKWKEIVSATNIGYKRILRFRDVTASKFRIRITGMRAAPAIASVGAYWYKTTPPQLQIKRNIQGKVSIEPLQSGFGWNPHGEDASKNLSSDFQIFYTTDGSQPNKNSLSYREPFFLNAGEIKAVAYLKNEKGSMANYRFGLLPNNWKLISASSETNKHEAVMAFDANQRTYWQSTADSSNQFIMLDLGKTATLKSFAYTPQTRSSIGMMEKGSVWVSGNGIEWEKTEAFEFGNLINDPTRRIHFFALPISTRYIRIESEKIAGNGNQLCIAELEFFE